MISVILTTLSMADANPNPNPNDLKVTVPESVRSGEYSNAVSVNVNSNEVVVDFGYLLPNTASPEIEVVSRVNMNHRTAESFLNVLGGAMEDFKKKQSEAGSAAPAPSAPSAPSAPAASAPAAPVAPAMPDAGSMPAGPAPEAPMPPLPNNA